MNSENPDFTIPEEFHKTTLRILLINLGKNDIDVFSNDGLTRHTSFSLKGLKTSIRIMCHKYIAPNHLDELMQGPDEEDYGLGSLPLSSKVEYIGIVNKCLVYRLE